MKSRTKIILSHQDIQKILQNCIIPIPQIRSVSELSDGWFNTAYKIETKPPICKTFVLKVAPSQNVPVLTYEHQAMEIEVKANKLLSDTGHIPVPYIYSADFSHQIIDYDYFLMDFLSGLSLE